MRPSLPALLAGALLTCGARANDLRYFDDAALHAVQLVDREGWAVGDEGAVWHTIDGGRTWERQPTGVRASLRALHFLNPYVGWVVGREELPLGAGSAGVLLFTDDGGLRWRRVSMNAMPGLNAVRFADGKTGYVAGDGTDQYPTGVFVTKDGGQTWRPVPGPRCPGWRAAALTGPEAGALVGAWNRLGTLREGGIAVANDDALGGRNLRAVHLGGDGRLGVAVGQGGLILLTDNAGGKWSYPELLLPPEVLSCWDFHAVHGHGKHIWAAGRPGSVLLHSADGGKTWQMRPTGQPLPINGLYFRDDKHGWAVGELGTILATADGGRTWEVRQQGGRRAALLFLHARPAGLPAGAVARLGADEGYLAAAVRVLAPDSARAAPGRAAEGDRFAAAMREAGGAAGELLWQFPLPPQLNFESGEDVVKAWDALHGVKAGEQLLRQLVLAIRLWRPDVLVTDRPGNKASGGAVDDLVAGAVREAFTRAADPKAFPEQIGQLGLQAWKAAKLYAAAEDDKAAQVALDLAEVRPLLQGSVRDFAAPAAGLLAEGPASLPRRGSFRLMASHADGAEKHRSFFEGVTPPAVGEARRKPTLAEELTREAQQALRTRASLQALTDVPIKGLSNPERVLATVGPTLSKLPDAMGAAAAHGIASQLTRQGQWYLAREAFLQMVERYPAHPLTADAFRWLIRHNSSSETRRRHELGQFLVSGLGGFVPPEGGEDPPAPPPGPAKKGTKGQAKREGLKTGPRDSHVAWAAEVRPLHFRADALRWHQSSLDLQPRLAGFGPLLADDPPIQFCLHAARRNLGDFDTSRKWFSDFVARQPAGPWRDAAAAELWLLDRRGAPPKPVALCRHAETRPFLDGKLDDACWQGAEPVSLQDGAADGARKRPDKAKAEWPATAWLAHDREFLYVALRCVYPPERHAEPVKGRQRDADLTRHDRVSIFLDLDRDYATCFHFQVDQRGCVREECWGDASWNPRWFVAVHSESGAWQIEAAIPIVALTGDAITGGRAWACNVVRVMPGRGVQAWSLPAGLPEEEPRLEGMGLLMFQADPRHEVKPKPTGPRMNPVP